MINEKLDEKIYYEHLDNGLDVVIVQKKGFVKKYATYATHFGSINYKFKAPGEKEVSVVPDGVAHFLEHKLFEEEDGVNALDKLSKLGSNANAYTSFNHTAYLFECTENFEKCLETLMSFVQSPYFTDENVEKEKGIIGQEINMYDDDPEWQLFFRFLTLLYDGHSITKDIAGTIDSISNITPEVLKRCYDTFYDPSNMIICVAGDVNVSEVMGLIKRNVSGNREKSDIDRFYDIQSKNENDKKLIEINMDVSMPMFLFGFKDNVLNSTKAGYNNENSELVKRHVAIEILFEIILGKSSKTYEELYNKGLIIREFGTDYTFEEDYAYSTISGESKDPKKVIEIVKDSILDLKKSKIDEKEFFRIKKMLYGEYVRVFNDTSRVATVFTSDYFKGINSLQYVDVYKNIDKKYVEDVLESHFNLDNMAVSIINPLEG